MIILNTTPLTPPAFKPVTVSMTFENKSELVMMQEFLDSRAITAEAMYSRGTNSYNFLLNLLYDISMELK